VNLQMRGGEGLGAKISKPSYYSLVSGVPRETTGGGGMVKMRWWWSVVGSALPQDAMVGPRPSLMLPRPSSCSPAVVCLPRPSLVLHGLRRAPPAIVPLPYACPIALAADATASPAAAVMASHTCALPHPLPMLLLLLQLQLQLCGCVFRCHRRRHAYVHPHSISPFGSYVLALRLLAPYCKSIISVLTIIFAYLCI